jgi:hypothetical protein
MDTYQGTLDDPMSLHKYMFANSNPVKYCDPSGHVTKEDFLAGMAISACIGAAWSAVDYTVIAFITDPGLENHSWEGCLCASLQGLIMGALFGLLLPLLYIPLVCFVVGVAGVYCGARTFDEGLAYFERGNIALGCYTMAKGVFGIILSAFVGYAGANGTGIQFRWNYSFNSIESVLNYFFPSRINTGDPNGFISDNVPENFQDNVRRAFASDVRVSIAEEDMVVYRYYGDGAGDISYWYTNQMYSDPNAALDLPPQNSAVHCDIYVIPAGTPYLEGTVASSLGGPGGGYQYYVPNPNNVQHYYLPLRWG